MKVRVEGLTKKYGPVAALRDVAFEAEPGRILAILGSNGAGKTTLLRCLGGIAAPGAGRILYDGEEFSRARLDLRRRFFYLPDTPYLLPGLTVIRHAGLVLRLYGADKPGVEERVIGILRDFDLLPLAEARIGTLSRGQAYKAALAALLAVDPEVWMLDEPFASGMDAHGIMAFKRYARNAAERGRTVFYTTQILDIAEAFSDVACILHDGEVRAFGSVAELRARTSGDGEVLEKIFLQLREESS